MMLNIGYKKELQLVASPLSYQCPFCRAESGTLCTTWKGVATNTHTSRKDLGIRMLLETIKD